MTGVSVAWVLEEWVGSAGICEMRVLCWCFVGKQHDLRGHSVCTGKQLFLVDGLHTL